MENYFFGAEEESYDPGHKHFVLVIYDICVNKDRYRLVKLLNGYGFRVQKSAFEAMLTESKYQKLIKALPPYAKEGDSIRVYKIHGSSAVTVFGENYSVEDEEVIVI
jgi:CRISPR-associated protein Cas2